jgi:transcriptional regulator with XRE-family HTH domain
VSRRLPPGVDGYAVNGRRLGPAELWDNPLMREALAARDVAAVFRRLQAAGVSQRRIAAAVGVNQSEISEILAGRRVKSVDVLERVADGLGVPRGWLGLAHQEPGAVPSPDVELLTAARTLLTAAFAMCAALGLSTLEVAS